MSRPGNRPARADSSEGRRIELHSLSNHRGGAIPKHRQHKSSERVPSRVGVFIQDLLAVMDEPRSPVVQPVGFLPDVCDVCCRHRTTAQEAPRLPPARQPVRPEALGLGVHPVLCEHVGIRFHSSGAFAPSLACGRDVNAAARSSAQIALDSIILLPGCHRNLWGLRAYAWVPIHRPLRGGCHGRRAVLHTTTPSNGP